MLYVALFCVFVDVQCCNVDVHAFFACLLSMFESRDFGWLSVVMFYVVL